MKLRTTFFVLVFCMTMARASAWGQADPQLISNIVISQVYGGGGNTGATYRNDFIELFNRGTSGVDLTGWSVQYASATGTTWQVTNLTNITLAPGQYYLIQEAQGAGGTQNLPTPDATGIIAMSATAGKVAFVNNQTALTGSCPTGASIIDFVGYGTTANCFEGSAPTAAPSNTTAVLRGANGCTETDNNATDFTADAPNPRNTSSPTNACSGCAAPGATANGGTLTCTTTLVVLSATSGTTGVTFGWAGPGITSGGTTANPVVSASGDYTVTVTTSAGGCTSTAIAFVNTNTTPPGASATGGIISCSVTSVVLSAAGGTSGPDFSWSGPGIISGGATANPRVSSSGTYTVTITSVDNGCTSIATAAVNTNAVPPGASATGGTINCATTAVVLSASSTSGTSFNWSGPRIVSGGTTANPTVNAAGTYTVTVTNSANGCTSSATAPVTATATPPGASATGGTLTCTTTSVVLSATTASGTSFTWTGPGIISGGSTSNPRVSSAGTYTVTVSNSATGCTSTATASVIANTSAPGTSATGGTLTCANTSVVLSAAGGGTQFSWTGPGIVSGGTSANPTVSSSGTYTVTVANSATGCSSTATASVATNVSAPGASAVGGTLTCTTTSVVLSASTTSGTTFNWAGPGIVSGGGAANPRVSAAGTYTVTVTNSANGCTSTATAGVNATSTPPGASATGGTLTATTTSVVLSAATSSGTSFSWAGPGIVSGGSTANPRVSASGTYTVTITNSASGCTSTATALVDRTTGVQEENAIPKEYSLSTNYPNPFNPVTNIRFSIVDRELTILKVYDVLGNEVAILVNEIKHPGTYTVQWNARGMASGVYFYSLKAGHFISTKKLLLIR